MAGRIVFAEELATNRILLKAWLATAAYTAVSAATPVEFFAALADTRPDLVILSDTIGAPGAATICRRLRAQYASLSVPLILLTEDTSRAARFAAFEAGADAVLPRVPDAGVLHARIRNLMRRHAAEAELAGADASSNAFELAEATAPGFSAPGQIALVAPSLADGLKWRNGLAACLRDRIVVLDPAHALADIDHERPPDAVVLAETPQRPGEAMQLLADLRSRGATLRSAIILVQAAPDRAAAIAALDLGVSDLVEHGFDAAELALILRRELARKARNDTRRAALRDGLRLAATDALTGLYNRRSAMIQLHNIVKSAPQNGEDFAILAMDLDRFKRINDSYGHAAGDAVLREVATRMNNCLRRGDFLARIGGEEFLVVMRNCDLTAAHVAAERLRRVVADTPVKLPDGKGRADITMSIGLLVCRGREAPQDAASLMDQADRGLYAAKACGRNQVTVCRDAA